MVEAKASDQTTNPVNAMPEVEVSTEQLSQTTASKDSAAVELKADASSSASEPTASSETVPATDSTAATENNAQLAVSPTPTVAREPLAPADAIAENKEVPAAEEKKPARAPNDPREVRRRQLAAEQASSED